MVCAGAVVVAAIVSRRLRLGVAIASAGLISAGVAVALRQAVGADVADSLAAGGLDVEVGSHLYPAVPLAVAVAMIAAAVPYVTRPLRRGMRVVIGLGCLAAVLSGDAIVLSSWPRWRSAGASGRWCTWGSGRRPARRRSVTSATRCSCLAWRRPTCTSTRNRTGVRCATWPPTPTVGAAHRRHRAGRHRRPPAGQGVAGVVWYRDSGPPLTLTRAQQVEHRAFLLLLAAQADVDGPDVVAMGVAGASAARCS